MTVAEAQGRISSREFTEWMAYYTLEPFGEARADLRAGEVAATIANVHRDPAKSRPFTAPDFMPYLSERDGEDAAAASAVDDKIRAFFAGLRRKE
jgi:Protein of unknown function (DUF4035)